MAATISKSQVAAKSRPVGGIALSLHEDTPRRRLRCAYSRRVVVRRPVPERCEVAVGLLSRCLPRRVGWAVERSAARRWAVSCQPFSSKNRSESSLAYRAHSTKAPMNNVNTDR
jgi:hypothetical protein